MLHKKIEFAVRSLLAVAAVMVVGQLGHTEPADSPADQRVFEIRTYTTEPGKLDDLLARFRDHTTALFEKHGIENISYWTPADEPRSADTLIYIVAHPSRDEAKKNWESFVNDPAWHKARDESEASGKIVSKVESVYVNPTDFSPLK